MENNNSNINEPTKNADEKILVSVVIAAYNIEKYIGQCLESIVNQTYKNIEILVGEDNGTDKTLEIIEKYGKKDSRIRLIKNEKNLGFSINKKNLITHANGDYICVLDGDDYVSEYYVENFVKNIGRADLINSGNYFFNEKINFEENKREGEIIINGKDLLNYYLLNYQNTFKIGVHLNNTWGKLYRKKDLLKHIDCFDFLGAEDVLLNAYIFNDISNILIIPTCDYYYRTRTDSQVYSKSHHIYITKVVYRLFNDFILKEGSDVIEDNKRMIVNNFVKTILSAHMSLLKIYNFKNPESRDYLNEILLYVKNKKFKMTKYFHIAKLLLRSEKLFYLLFVVPFSIRGKMIFFLKKRDKNKI